MSKQAGIKDIAKAAGVSTATVSRTLRNPELVSKATREKVMEAVNASNYRPNQMGISLRTKRTNNVVAIIPDITNPFIASVVRAIEQQAQQYGYNVLLGDTQGHNERIHHYAGMVGSRQADGIILFSHYMPFKHDGKGNLIDTLPPLVNSCEDTGIHGINKVMIDNQAAAVTAINHLLALGHSKIACITGPLDTDSSKNRMLGYRQALEDAGIQYKTEYVIEGDHQMPTGSKGAEALMQLADKPSAIFCFNDEMAIGAMSALQEQGYRIPQDISVMGFDDIRFSQYTKPALTTIRQPVQQIGEQCMSQLMSLIKEEEPQEQYINLPTELMVRQSTGPYHKK